MTVLAVVAAVGLVAGCSDPEPGMVGDDPRIVVHDLTGALLAEISGELVYDPDSLCLFRRTNARTRLEDPGGQLSVMLWPPGTKPVIHEDRSGVDVPRLGRILEGDTFVTAGGSVSRSSIAGWGIPAECLPDDVGLILITPVD